jgi:glutathione S-transferase
MNADGYMLRTTLTSPFGRKVRIAAEVLGLGTRVKVVHADTADEHDTLHQQNPLGKIPCLVLTDGTAIYDSSVILEFLQHVVGGEKLMPLQGVERFNMLTLTRCADGIIDAGALIIYEARYHEEGTASEKWLAHQRRKISRALNTFEAAPPDPTRTDSITIGLACALGFLDKRKPIHWRPSCPRLVEWIAAFEANEPAFYLTRPPEA